MDYYQNETQVLCDAKTLVNLCLLRNRNPDIKHPALSDERLRHLKDGFDRYLNK